MIAYLFGIAFLICSLYVINITPIAVTYVIVGVICAIGGTIIGSVRKRNMLLVYLFGVMLGVFSYHMKDFTSVAIAYIIAAGVCALFGSLGMEVVKNEIKKEEKRRERMEKLFNNNGKQNIPYNQQNRNCSPEK